MSKTLIKIKLLSLKFNLATNTDTVLLLPSHNPPTQTATSITATLIMSARVPLSLSSLLLVRSALDDFFVSTTESFMVKSSIMFTKDSFSCSALTKGALRFSAVTTETRCTASLLRCSSSRFLNTHKKQSDLL